MKKILALMLLLLSLNSFCQKSKELNDYVLKINQTIFTDTVSLEDVQLNQKVSIQGFFKGDEVLKAKINFIDLNRSRVVYYKRGINLLNDVCLVIDYEMESGAELIKIESWDNKILKSRLKEVVHDDEKNNPKKILEHSDFTTVLEFKKIDDQAEKYEFSARLVDTLPLPAYCGTFAWASAYMFEIIETDFKTEEKNVVIIITCPRERGEEFYESGKTYSGIIATNSGVTFSWSLSNNYENQNLPTFWARAIEKE